MDTSSILCLTIRPRSLRLLSAKPQTARIKLQFKARLDGQQAAKANRLLN